jgi:hypothetical protein
MQNVTKWSLWALLVPALPLALMTFFVGAGFGVNLWRADRPFAVAMWFAVVGFPAWLIVALRSQAAPRRFYGLAISAWLFAAFWIFHNFWWMPWTAGGPHGW